MIGNLQQVCQTFESARLIDCNRGFIKVPNVNRIKLFLQEEVLKFLLLLLPV